MEITWHIVTRFSIIFWFPPYSPPHTFFFFLSPLGSPCYSLWLCSIYVFSFFLLNSKANPWRKWICLFYLLVICIYGRCKSCSLRVYICYETQQSFPSSISRKEVLLALADPSELWSNCSFYGMFPVFLFCIKFFFYLFQESSHLSLIKHFLREYLVLVTSPSVWILAWVFLLSGVSPMIDWLMGKLTLLLISGFPWLVEITPGHLILGKPGPEDALPPPVAHADELSS